MDPRDTSDNGWECHVGTISVIDGEMGPNPSVTLFPNLPIGEGDLVAVRRKVVTA